MTTLAGGTSTEVGGPGASGYDVFLSYSRQDVDVATALERGLRRLTKPLPISRRALRVFRDSASLGSGGDLPAALRRAVSDSRYFVLVASPDSARSTWVQEEVNSWLAIHGTENLVIAVVGGTWAWDRERSRFDPIATDALPPPLLEAIDREPILVDLRWTEGTASLSLRHQRFRAAVADIAAPVHGRARDELESEDIRRRRVGRNLVTVAAGVLVVVSATAIWQAFRATAAERRANDRATEAVAGRLATQGELGTAAPDLSFLLLAAAMAMDESPATRAALLRGMSATPLQSWVSGPRTPTEQWLHLAVSDDGTLAASLDVSGRVDVWEVSSGRHRSARFVTIDPNDGWPRIIEQSEEANSAPTSSAPTSSAPDLDAASIAMIGEIAVDDRGDVVLATLTGHLAWLTADGGFSELATNCIALDHLQVGGSAHEGAFSCGVVPAGEAAATDGPPALMWFRDGVALTSTVAQSTIAAVDVTDDGSVAAVYAVDTEATDDEWHLTIRSVDGGTPAADFLTTDLVNDVAISPDGTRVALATQRGQIQLFSLADPAAATQFVRVLGTDPLVSVGFSADGSRILTGDTSGQVGLWDSATLDPVRRWRGHTDLVSSVVAGDDNRVVSTDDGSVASWSSVGNSLIRELPGVTGDVMSVALLDGERVMVAAENGFQLMAGPIDQTPTVVGERLPTRIMSIDVSLDGTTVATGDALGNVVVRNAATLAVVRELSVGDNVVFDLALSPDGATVAAAVNAIGAVVHDVATGQRRYGVESPSTMAVAFSPDGRLVAVGGMDGSVSLHDWERSKEVARSDLHRGGAAVGVKEVLFLDNGSQIASAAMDGSVVIASVPELTPLLTMKAAGLDPRALWVHAETLGAIDAFGTVYIWDRVSGEPLGRLESGAQVWDAAMTERGELVVGLVGRAVDVWTLDPSMATALACELVGRDLTTEEWERYAPDVAGPPTCTAGA